MIGTPTTQTTITGTSRQGAKGSEAAPLHIHLASATLSYDAPDHPDHPAGDPTQAFLTVRLQSDLPEQATSQSDAFLVFGQAVTAAAITLAVPGAAPQPSTLVSGGGGDNPTTFAANLDPDGVPVSEYQPPPWGAFPDTYYFTVPADLTTATLTITPGTLAAMSNLDPTLGTATPDQGARAQLAITLPAPTTYLPPAGSSPTPGTLTATAPVDIRTSGGNALPLTLLVLALVLAATVAGLVVRRRPRRPAPAGPAAQPSWPAPAAPAPPAWPDPASAPPAVTADPAPAPSSASAVDDPEPTPPPAPPAEPDPAPAPPPVPTAGGCQQPPAPLALPGLVIRVLGVLRFEGWARPPEATNLVELALYLALRRRAVPGDRLRRLSGRGSAELSPETLRSYCSRLRRHLTGPAELVNNARGYELRGVTTDLAVLVDAEAAARQHPGPESAHHLAAALALVEGRPLDGSDYRWASELDLATPIRDAALTLADLTTTTEPELALWG